MPYLWRVLRKVKASSPCAFGGALRALQAPGDAVQAGYLELVGTKAISRNRLVQRRKSLSPLCAHHSTLSERHGREVDA